MYFASRLVLHTGSGTLYWCTCSDYAAPCLTRLILSSSRGSQIEVENEPLFSMGDGIIILVITGHRHFPGQRMWSMSVVPQPPGIIRPCLWNRSMLVVAQTDRSSSAERLTNQCQTFALRCYRGQSPSTRCSPGLPEGRCSL